MMLNSYSIVLLAIGLCSVISTRAEGESQNVGGEAKKGLEIEVGDKEKEEKMKKILQRQLEDAKGETDWAKMIASLSITVAQLEEGMRAVENDKKEMEQKLMENEKKVMENDKKMMQMEKAQLENRKEVKNLHLQLKKVRQQDQKTGPVAPLAKFLIETGTNVKNNTKRIVALEKGLNNLKFGGKGSIPYGTNFIRLLPSPTTGTTYGVNKEALGWDVAREACVANGGELASIETVGEWRFLFENLNKKDPTYTSYNYWLGGSKAGPVVSGLDNHNGFKWLSGNAIPSNFFAWSSGSGKGRCILVNSGAPVDNIWLDYPCYLGYRSVCEFKKKE